MAKTSLATDSTVASQSSRLIVRLLVVLIISAVSMTVIGLLDDGFANRSLPSELHLSLIGLCAVITVVTSYLLLRQDQAHRQRAMTDSNEHDRMAAAQRESEAKFKAQYKGFPIPTVTWQRSGDSFIFADYNGAADDFTKGGVAQYVNKTAASIYADRPDIVADIARCFTERRTLGREMACPYETAGPDRTVMNTCVYVPPDLVMMHTEDITGRKKAEIDLQRNADALKLLYEAGLTLNSHRNPRAQLVAIYGDYMKMLHADRAEFFRYDASTELLHLEFTLEHPDGSESDTMAERRRQTDTQDGHVAASAQRQTVRLHDVYADPNWVSVDSDVRSSLFTPVWHDNQLLGIVTVLRTTENAFTTDDLRLLELAANQVAVVLVNARLFEQTDHQLRQLQALHTIDTVILSNFDLNATLNAILNQIMPQLGADAAAVWLSQSPSSLRCVASRGFQGEALTSTVIPLGDNGAGQVAIERHPIQIPQLANAGAGSPRYLRLAGQDFSSYYGAPLISKGQVKGVLEIYTRRPHLLDVEWLNLLDMLASQVAIAIDNSTTFMELQRVNMELTLAYDDTIEGWSRALDLRDRETEGHTQRVTRLTLRLARSMGLGEADLMYIRWGALLHDIGKMGVPDHVLLKPGPLTSEERAVMVCHPRYAYEMLAPIAHLRPALDIPFCHHEKWDGSGYPRGLKGDEIPLSARIFAVVDVADALASNRPYQKAWPNDRVRQYVREQSGAHFDPAIVDAYLSLA